MRNSFRRSRKGLDTIVAEVLMLLIIIIMSSIVFIWVVPTFQSSQVGGNSGAQYSEKFSTLWGSFATFAQRTPETLLGVDPFPSATPCTGSITSPTSASFVVPANTVCVITANVGSVYVSSGANLTVVGATINGQLWADSAASVTLRNTKVTDWTNIENVGVVNISGSSLNTSGDTSHQTDTQNSAIYDGGPGLFNFANNTVNGSVESEVSHQAIVIGNTISNGKLEIESADFGQITNNKVAMIDVDQNGIVVISGNTVYGNDQYYVPSPGSPCPSGTGTAICFGNPGGNRWCAQGNNVVTAGFQNGQACIGNVEIDIINTGNIPVNLVAVYMSSVPLSGPVSWKLLSGGTVHNSLPIAIPVGQGANVTMQWTPPVNLKTLPWTDIYFIFVSSHNNFVDGHIYFGYNPALTVTSQSRPENQVCPPCY